MVGLGRARPLLSAGDVEEESRKKESCKRQQSEGLGRKGGVVASAEHGEGVLTHRGGNRGCRSRDRNDQSRAALPDLCSLGETGK